MTEQTARSGRVLVRVLIILAVVGGLAATGYLVHRHRKEAAVREALTRGLEAYNAGQYGKAAGHLGRYLSVDRRNVDILLKYADAQLQRRPQTKETMQQTISAYETALRVEQGHTEATEKLSQLYLLTNSPVEAERVVRARLARFPDDEMACRHLAAALIAQQKTDEAIEVLRAVVARNPHRVDAAGTLAFLLLTHKKDTPACEKLLDETVSGNPDSAAARIVRARYYLAGGRSKQAIDELNAAEKSGFSDVGTRIDLGRILLALGLDDRANAQFDLAEKSAPTDPGVYLARGLIAIERGDVEGGAALADRALAAPLGERRFDVLAIAGELYALAKRTGDARNCIEELRKADAPSSSLKYLAALVALAEGRNDEGAAGLEEVIAREPKNSRALLLLGRTYVRNGQLRRAVGPLREYVRLEGGSAATVQLELAGIYATLGRWADAAEVAADAERRWPNSLPVRLINIEMQAMLAGHGGALSDPTTAASLLKKVQDLVTQYPKDVRPRILQARLAAWQGRVKDAVTVLTAARNELDDKLALTRTLFEMYADAGDYQKAITECEAAVALAGKDQRPSLRIRLAELHLAKGDAARASELVEQATSQPTGPGRSAGRLAFARALLRQNKEEQARDLLIRIVSEDDGNIPARLMLLAMKPVKEKGPGHQELVEQLKRIEGDSGPNWRLWQARLWLEGEKWTEHRKEIESLVNECLAKDPGWGEAAMTAGWMHEKAGEISQAMAVYRRAFDTDARNLDAARRLLALAAQAEQWTEVDRLLEALPADDPRLQEHRIAQALRRNDTERAVHMLEARVKTDANDFVARLQLAGLLREKNDSTRADALLAEAARIAPEAPQVLASRVALCLSRSEFGPALELCNQALARKPGADAFALRARVHEQSGKLDLAEDDLKRIIGLEGMAETGYLALGQFHGRHGRRDQALQVWREGLTAVPGSVALRKAMVLAMSAAEDAQQREAGSRLLEELLAERPDDEILLMMQADSLRRTDPAKAERIYEKIIQTNPTVSGAFQALAQLAAGRGQRDRALQIVDRGLGVNRRDMTLLMMKCDLLMTDSPNRAVLAGREAMALQPGNEVAVIALAKALAVSGNPGEATETLKNFLAGHAPAKTIGARLALAGLYRTSGDFKQADELIRQAAETAPDDPAPVQARLVWYRAQNQWDKCIELAETRRKAQPDDVATARLAAHLLLESKEKDHRLAARQLLEHVAVRRPHEAESHADLGAAYYGLGRIDDARAAFERGLQIDPNNIRLLNDLTWLVCEDQKNPRQALAWADKALKSGSDNPSLLDTLGVLQYRLGKLEESRETLERCLAHPHVGQPTKLAASVHLGRTLMKLDVPKARKVLEQVLRDPASDRFLSPADRQEAQNLLQQPATASAPARK